MAQTFDINNPLRIVGTTAVKCPAVFQWDLMDVSSPASGRTQDGKMQKMRLTQKVKIQLSWNALSTSEVSAILQAFNPEYIPITYLDPMAGDYVTKTFYVGDRSAPMYNAKKGLWKNVSFDIIEQ